MIEQLSISFKSVNRSMILEQPTDVDNMDFHVSVTLGERLLFAKLRVLSGYVQTGRTGDPWVIDFRAPCCQQVYYRYLNDGTIMLGCSNQGIPGMTHIASLTFPVESGAHEPFEHQNRRRFENWRAFLELALAQTLDPLELVLAVEALECRLSGFAQNVFHAVEDQAYAHLSLEDRVVSIRHYITRHHSGPLLDDRNPVAPRRIEVSST